MADPGSQRAAICHDQLRWGGEMRRESKQAERTETTNSITKKKPQKLGVTVLNLQMRYSRTGDTCRKVQRNMSENIEKTKQETQK